MDELLLTQLLTQLRQTWHSTIPVSEFMQIVPLDYREG
ncbi:MAG: YiiD C-terminal domain-containing protein, partial [Shewanella sp.]|nr:YiiD C-terminal domain-containing protein [Shewanella sp.]